MGAFSSAFSSAFDVGGGPPADGFRSRIAGGFVVAAAMLLALLSGE